MSKIYGVAVTIKCVYSEKNIEKVINNGGKIGFIYYDRTLAELDKNSLILTPKEALEKILALKKNQEDDQSLYVEIAPGRYAHLWFYKSEYGYLKIDLGAFGNVKEEIFPYSGEAIDFEFYIHIALLLANGFAIEKMVADYFE